MTTTNTNTSIDLDIKIQDLKKIRSLRFKLSNQVRQLSKKINKMEQDVFNRCEHNWIIDRSGGSYGNTPYTCSICDSSKC
jgi:hypothetical protein